MEAQSAMVAALSATSGITLYTAMMPRASALSGVDPEDMRVSEVVAGSLTLGFGAMMAVLTSSHIPLSVALITAVSMTIAYEYAIRARGNKNVL